MEGWGELSINNLKKAITKSQLISLDRFIFSIGIRHIGQENAKILAGFFKSIDKFCDLFDEKSRKKIKGIANIGYRPTFNQKKLLLEVNLFKFSGNLYNKNLTINFTKFIRGETKFKNIDALKKQINKDIKVAKR